MTLIVYHIQNGIVSIISYLHQNIEGESFMGVKGKNVEAIKRYIDGQLQEDHMSE